MLIAGKTIAVSLANFWAEVSIVASARLRLVPHPLNDPNEFGSLADLHGISRKEGYQGGLILLQVWPSQPQPGPGTIIGLTS